MKRFKSVRTSAVECFKYQVVYSARFLASLPVKVDFKVTVIPQVLPEERAAPDAGSGTSRKGTHTTVIAHLVQALPVKNRFPDLAHASPNAGQLRTIPRTV